MLLGPFPLDPKGQFRPKNHLTLLSLSGVINPRSAEERDFFVYIYSCSLVCMLQEAPRLDLCKVHCEYSAI
jgi:hypothetical protein